MRLAFQTSMKLSSQKSCRINGSQPIKLRLAFNVCGFVLLWQVVGKLDMQYYKNILCSLQKTSEHSACDIMWLSQDHILVDDNDITKTSTNQFHCPYDKTLTMTNRMQYMMYNLVRVLSLNSPSGTTARPTPKASLMNRNCWGKGSTTSKSSTGRCLCWLRDCIETVPWYNSCQPEYLCMRGLCL